MLSPNEKKILAEIAGNELTRIAVEAAKVPSYSPPTGTEQAIAELFATELRRYGVDVELQEVEPSRPNVLGSLGSRRDTAPTVLFNGHIDTSPPVIGWTRDPYGGEIDGDRLYGHGVSNMKGSDCAMIAALGALARSKVDLPGRVVVSLVMGECRGGEGTKYMLRQGLRANWFINGEPTDLRVLTLQAGSCQLRLTTTGRTHHHGIPGKGVNAIEKLIKILTSLGESGPIGENGWLRKSSRKREYDGFPRLNLGTIRGGLTRECLDWGPYMTPDYAVATIDVRYSPDLSLSIVKTRLEDVISKLRAVDPEISADVEIVGDFPPFEAALDDVAVSTIVGAATDVLGKRPEVGAIAPIKFMGADAGKLQAAGIAGVMYGVGTLTSSVPDEYIEISKLMDLTKVYAVTAYRLLAAAEGKDPEPTGADRELNRATGS